MLTIMIWMESARKKFGQPVSTCVKILDMTSLKFSALFEPTQSCETSSAQKNDEQSSGTARLWTRGTVEVNDDCFSFDHPFHQQLYSYVNDQAALAVSAELTKEGSVHVTFPEAPPQDSQLEECSNLSGLHVLTRCCGHLRLIDCLRHPRPPPPRAVSAENIFNAMKERFQS
ncbi:hypothetical protein LguiB_026900 [Lonicera macranthoides]